jgi:hypothetical protein
VIETNATLKLVKNTPQSKQPAKKIHTRERWLNDAAAILKKTLPFGRDTTPAENVHFSCSWPVTGARGKKKTIGECWAPSASSDGKTYHIHITPLLEKETEVLAVLAHELVHQVVGTDKKHKGDFIRVAKAIGLKGPWRSTTATPELEKRLNALADKLGKYPHFAILTEQRKKQGIRLIKIACPSCGYTCRTTRMWIDRYERLPICPCPDGEEMVEC